MQERYILEVIKYVGIIVWIIIILTILFKKTKKEHHSNWSTLIDDFDFDTDEFYELFKDKLKSKGIEYVSFKVVNLRVGSIIPERKKYLRVRWRDYEYFICASAFASGFFVSWWLSYKKTFFEILISKIPFIGEFLARKLSPVSYYSVDSASAFMSYTQSIVTDIIEDITKDSGVKLSLENQKPIMNDIFKR